MLKIDTKEDLKSLLKSYKKSKRTIDFINSFSFTYDCSIDSQLYCCEFIVDTVEYIISLLDNDTLKYVCYLRYIECKRYSEIADIMCYSENYVKSLSRKAIDELFSIVHIH